MSNQAHQDGTVWKPRDLKLEGEEALRLCGSTKLVIQPIRTQSVSELTQLLTHYERTLIASGCRYRTTKVMGISAQTSIRSSPTRAGLNLTAERLWAARRGRSSKA
jgi:hypothetical protein